MQVNVVLNKQSSKDYSVHIGKLEKLVFDTKVLVVTNSTVAALHLETLKNHIAAKELHTIILPDGEMYKNFESLNLILNACFEHRLDRKSLLIAFGGGVIGDMTGFAASMYQRGIDFIQIPTTLLSQVDASVGGKTGINNAYGKNLIGAFWQPRAVYCESAFLKTLPKREFSAGVALAQELRSADGLSSEGISPKGVAFHHPTAMLLHGISRIGRFSCQCPIFVKSQHNLIFISILQFFTNDSGIEEALILTHYMQGTCT